MGRIAPRRRRSSRVYQPVLHAWLSLRQRAAPERDEEEEAEPEQPQASGLRRWFGDQFSLIAQRCRQVWHIPDSFDWMEPLPYFHRRWLIIATAVLLLALLWPYSDPREVRYDPSVGQPAIMQANLNDVTVPVLLRQQRTTWQEYYIKTGQTLAQLFRENRLDINDVFAIAQSEGHDKPLSNLKAGQVIRIQHNAHGQVTALELETTNGEQIFFRRQPDGSFKRLN